MKNQDVSKRFNVTGPKVGGISAVTGRIDLPSSNAQKASATLQFPGANNDITIVARQLGTKFNGVQVSVEDKTTSGVVVTWTPTPGTNAVGGTLLLQIGPGTTAAAVVTAINAKVTNGFQASLAPEGTSNSGLGTVSSSSRLLQGGTSTPDTTTCASATVSIPGANNDLQITAVQPGEQFNGTISFINTGNVRQ